MLNPSILIVVAMCVCLHLAQWQNEATLTAPVTMLKCTGSIFPKKRKILCQKVLSDREFAFVQGLFEAAHKDRYAFVCCEYFLQTEDGRTVGIMVDDDQELAEGFDLGKKMNAKETHTKCFHNTKMIRDRADQKRLYFLVHKLFSGSPKDL